MMTEATIEIPALAILGKSESLLRQIRLETEARREEVVRRVILNRDTLRRLTFGLLRAYTHADAVQRIKRLGISESWIEQDGWKERRLKELQGLAKLALGYDGEAVMRVSYDDIDYLGLV